MSIFNSLIPKFNREWDDEVIGTLDDKGFFSTPEGSNKFFYL